MKKLSSFLVLCIFLVLVIPVSAEADTIFVHDFANILNTGQEADLSQKALDIKKAYEIDVIILTTPTLYGEDILEFTDNFYSNNRFDDNSVLFVVDMGSRQWQISTLGTAVELLSDRDLAAIEGKVIPYLSDIRYYDAFSAYLSILPGYFVSGTESGVNLLVSLLAGAAIAAVSILAMRSTMNSKKAQRSAACYETDGSFHLHQNQDLFLYSNISKRAKPQNNNTGSSLHRSSSGRSYGGRSGKF